jgi:hypothetical protein
VPDERVAEALASLRSAAALLAEAAQVAGATGDPERLRKLDDAARRVRALADAFEG